MLGTLEQKTTWTINTAEQDQQFLSISMGFQQSTENVKCSFSQSWDQRYAKTKESIISHKHFHEGKACRDKSWKSPSEHKESSAVK